ncbi:porin [Paraburkholderia sp. MMS20-SJTR3]|uniref:Porin n=1 Tax=Paraburkholderia sejongensis TaxID=2886946 RepID=A0ABS8JT40_9BURK|nr:porin [Paraburkholderia sp. MMS20-SJTR3]MCC8393085.1 porin [Paraburkholderia sp. MMS20-SJTR3]
MKKLLVAVAGTCAVAGMARAQSNVTLYGLIDAGVNYTTNVQTSKPAGRPPVGGSQVAMLDGGLGGLSGSRWGLKGAEDLGGGWKAIFQLESGINFNNGSLGQGGAMFGRQAFVGMSGAPGTLTLGRQYDSLRDFVQSYAATGQLSGVMGARPDDLDNLADSRRLNNAIKYTSPKFSGFTFGGMYSLGGIAGATGRNQFWSVGMNYVNGPFAFGTAYVNARNPNLSYFGTNPNSSTSPTGNNMGFAGSATAAQYNPVYAGFASAHTMQIFGAATTYDIGSFTLGVNYTHTRFDDLGDTATSGPNPYNYSGNAVFDSPEVNLQYQVTPALRLGAAYNYTHLKRANYGDTANYNQYSAGAAYALSKRTVLYGVAVFQTAGGTDSLNQPAVASIDGLTPSATSRQASFRLGLRHYF